MRSVIGLLIATTLVHGHVLEEQLQLELPSAQVGGTLTVPHEDDPPFPCVLIIGGTLSQTRDGGLTAPGAPERTALKRLAEGLAGGGYASFRYDTVGFGASKAKAGWKGLYSDDARVAGELMTYLRGRSECSRVIVAGESAGAYVASLAARAGAEADAYLFLGGFCGKAEEIFAYNHGRLADFFLQNEANREWAKANKLDRIVAFGKHWREMFAAAREGKDSFALVEGAVREEVALARRREEIDNPPDAMFAFIQRPALALAGDRDLNVAPGHAACAEAVMRQAGNKAARSALIAGADHSFQLAPDDPDAAFRERFTLASFRRPYHPGLDEAILTWLNEVAPPRSGVPTTLVVPTEGTQPASEVSPERVNLAPGVTIIDDITDFGKVPGVDTLEGRIGPLLRVPEMRAHYIDMPAGLYLEEHPHAKGSIIYTVRGTWALKSAGRWHTMKPGSLYWFGDNIPTGYMVPFRENAYILIFKAAPGSDDAEFMTYLKGMAEGLVKDQAKGTAFRLVDLPEGHPGLDVARTMNPRFDDQFPRKK
ncbi:MAG: alpha/beta fold hydrolase [Bryobacterales bacterium]|nr:alpha/beta fold hydrolase [Bryobacterales bacterium]